MCKRAGSKGMQDKTMVKSEVKQSGLGAGGMTLLALFAGGLGRTHTALLCPRVTILLPSASQGRGCTKLQIMRCRDAEAVGSVRSPQDTNTKKKARSTQPLGGSVGAQTRMINQRVFNQLFNQV